MKYGTERNETDMDTEMVWNGISQDSMERILFAARNARKVLEAF
jgi:hypothetical protein